VISALVGSIAALAGASAIFGTDRITNNDAAMFGSLALGFVLGGGIALGLMRSLTAEMKSLSEDTARTLKAKPAAGDRRILPWTASLLFLGGAYLWWDLYRWEIEGGTRLMKGIEYSLYVTLGKSGVAGLFWVPAVLIVVYLLYHRRRS
jgi:hypothetical protein